jgi:hypothetical protein
MDKNARLSFCKKSSTGLMAVSWCKYSKFFQQVLGLEYFIPKFRFHVDTSIDEVVILSTVIVSCLLKILQVIRLFVLRSVSLA